jgi:hypothetical protein
MTGGGTRLLYGAVGCDLFVEELDTRHRSRMRAIEEFHPFRAAELSAGFREMTHCGWMAFMAANQQSMACSGKGSPALWLREG